MTSSANQEKMIYLYYDVKGPLPSSEWRCALAIPADLCLLKSPSPVKWLRYAAGIVCGREGHLHHAIPINADDHGSQSQKMTEGPQLTENEYSARTVDAISTCFCYLPTDRQATLLWADPLACLDEALTPWPPSNSPCHRVRHLNKKVLERDEDRCILTGAASVEAFLQTFPLIPHSKGPQYIAKAKNYRLEQDICEPDTVDDPRNHLTLLNVICNEMFTVEKKKFIFLPVPNFAMSLNDVYDEPPSANDPQTLAWQYARVKNDTWANQRIQFQFLNQGRLPWTMSILITSGAIRGNTDLRLPHDLSTMPPTWLLELFSASVIIQNFGCDDILWADNIRNIYAVPAMPDHPNPRPLDEIDEALSGT